MWDYWGFGGAGIVEALILGLIFAYLFLIFCDFMSRASLFEILGIGGYFSALILVLADYKLYVAYNTLLKSKGLNKKWHGLIPATSFINPIVSYFFSEKSIWFILIFVYRFIFEPEKLKHKNSFESYIMIFVVVAILCLLSILNFFVYVWTALATCAITGRPWKHAVVYIFLPFFRAGALIDPARDYMEDKKKKTSDEKSTGMTYNYSR